ncbi:EAL domain-containing protein [Vibrio parahaemolyticus]|nr:EAL domain-containing protein [Vibrio parahaemolyticus]
MPRNIIFVGVEVLCRWHSNKGIVMPGDFIEDLEKFGFFEAYDS